MDAKLKKDDLRLSDKRIRAWRCHACGKFEKKRVKQPYSYDYSHDGRPPTTITIPDLEVIACTNPDCPGHETRESTSFDAAATLRITIETYRQLGLLTPDEVRAGRKKLGLKQSELQELLGLGGNSLSRWEKARVYQSRSMDKLLRIVFGVPEARAFLAAIHPLPLPAEAETLPDPENKRPTPRRAVQ